MKYLQLSILGLLSVLVVACQAYDEEMDAESNSQTEQIVRFPLGVRSASSVHGHHNPPVGASAAEEEEAINNVVIAGVAQSSYNQTQHSLDVPSGALSRSFYFAANLTASDQTRVTGSSSPERLELNTLDYLKDNGELKNHSIPLVASLDNVKYSDFSANSGVVQSLLRYKKNVDFTRAFAKVEFVAVPQTSDITLTKIEVINVPKKFALGGVIADYDVKDQATYGYTVFNVPLKKESNNYVGTFYLPEHAVLNPVFSDPDTHNMTCLEFTYVDGENKEYKKKVRIAMSSTDDVDNAKGKNGIVLRNYLFRKGPSLDKTADVPGVSF